LQKNKLMKKILIILSTLLLLASCTSYEELRSNNRYNISKITLGLSVEDVKKIMGEDSADCDYLGRCGQEIFRNPYKTETTEHKGNNYLIYYYYTERIGDKSWETGVTPIIFLNNKVVGIGWRSMEKLELESPSKTIKLR